mmetsp:Transcript_57965/g.129944  ORF Transcript_57965/g.129944 Transcript_57965/m.129944 type:complete len:84 (-) Transcript_57965:7-258(-)
MTHLAKEVVEESHCSESYWAQITTALRDDGVHAGFKAAIDNIEMNRRRRSLPIEPHWSRNLALNICVTSSTAGYCLQRTDKLR